MDPTSQIQQLSLGDVNTTILPPTIRSIPRHEIQLGRELGKGGFGTVYEGSWDFRKVAVKRYEGSRLPERTAREIRHEVSVMQGLDHECLIRLFGLVEEDSLPAMLVMEFGANGSLYTYLHSDSEIPWMHRLRLAEELARGLAYLHDKGIVHRDIKSLNIVLDKDFHAKWCDFGLAQLKQHATTTSKAYGSEDHGVVGTLHWMAPEQFSRKSSAPSMRSDVWGLGMVYYEITTREIPFKEAQTPQQVITWIMSGEGEEVPADLIDQAPEFGAVMRRCWAALNERPTAAEIALEVDVIVRRMNGGDIAERANFSYGAPSEPIDSGYAAFTLNSSGSEEKRSHSPVNGERTRKEPLIENRGIQLELPRFIEYKDESSGIECLRRIHLDRDSGAIPNQETKNTWLHIAAKIEHPVMLMGFFAFDPKINLEQRNAENMTPLMLALKEQKEQSVEILLDIGADIYALSEKHDSALHLAARTSERLINIILQKKGASLNLEIENSRGETPLFAAIRAKQTETAFRLIDEGANIHKFNKEQTANPLSAAAWSSETRVVKYLLEKGVESNNTSLFLNGNKYKGPPIFGAAFSGADLEMVNALIEAGNDPHTVLDNQINLVYFSIFGAEKKDYSPNRPVVLEFLLKDLKLNPNVQEPISGDTLIHLTTDKDVRLLHLLLKYGANPNVRNKKGETPLSNLCERISDYKAETLTELLNAGADPNFKGKSSKSCFHRFVENTFWFYQNGNYHITCNIS